MCLEGTAYDFCIMQEGGSAPVTGFSPVGSRDQNLTLKVLPFEVEDEPPSTPIHGSAGSWRR
jgi:hypothetical protein